MLREDSRKMFRPAYWKRLNISEPDNFSTKPIEPSRFLEPFWTDDYWRDVPTHIDMNEGFQAYNKQLDFNYDVERLERSELRIIKLFQSHYGANTLVTKNTYESCSAISSKTSAGLPFKPEVRCGKVTNNLKRMAVWSWRRLKRGESFKVVPCIAGCRCELREKGTNKPRLVWEYPAYINVLENQFVLPFMEDKPSFMGCSYNWLDEGRSMDKLMDRAKSGSCWMNLVFSGFDSTVTVFLIRSAFRVVKSVMNLNDYELSMLHRLISYFIYTPLLLFSKVEYKHRGIPSGSAFAQLIGTIVNMIACAYADDCFHDLSINLERSVWLGNESSLSFQYDFGKTDTMSNFLDQFKLLGLTVNSDKTKFARCYSDEEFCFLGKSRTFGRREWIVDNVKLVAKAVIPESADKCPDDAIQRLCGLCWSYGYDPDSYRILLRMYFHIILLNPNYDISHVMIPGLNSSELTTFPRFRAVVDRHYGHFESSIGL